MLGHAILTRRTGRRTGLAARLLLLSIAALAPAGCRKEQAVGSRPPPLVTVAQAEVRDVPVYIDEIGECSAFELVSIRPQASGQILQRHFVDGADLKKDDLLFTIDPRPYQATVDQAQAALAQSQAAQSLAKSEFERAETLLPTKAISKEDYETRKSAVEVAQAQIQANQAAIQTAKLNLKYCFIRSPTEGRVGQRQVDAGNIVSAANPIPMLVIQRMDPIYADFTITERDLSAVREAMASAAVKVRVRLPEDPEGQAREGDLTFLDNAVQAATGTVRLRATPIGAALARQCGWACRSM